MRSSSENKKMCNVRLDFKPGGALEGSGMKVSYNVGHIYNINVALGGIGEAHENLSFPPAGQRTTSTVMCKCAVAGWGETDVYLNDELVFEDLDAHFMVTEGLRDSITRYIYNMDRTGFYDPANPTDAITFPNRIFTRINAV